MGKESSVFNQFNNISTGSGTFTSSVSGTIYRDNIGYQVNFTGSPQGTLQFNGSNDYNPQLPQTANPQNSSTNGSWFTFASVSMASVVSPYALNIQNFPFAFIQCQFISSSAVGTLTGWISTKSLGS